MLRILKLITSTHTVHFSVREPLTALTEVVTCILILQITDRQTADWLRDYFRIYSPARSLTVVSVPYMNYFSQDVKSRGLFFLNNWCLNYTRMNVTEQSSHADSHIYSLPSPTVRTKHTY